MDGKECAWISAPEVFQTPMPHTLDPTADQVLPRVFPRRILFESEYTRGQRTLAAYQGTSRRTMQWLEKPYSPGNGRRQKIEPRLVHRA
jgi:hypothetical protein